MEDQRIIELYWARNEAAIDETARKYGKLCRFVAGNILTNASDCEECVNDTYLGVWNAIPTQRPQYFSIFISRITRNLALKRFSYLTAAKRSIGITTSLDELDECVSGRESPEDALEGKQIREALNHFLAALPEEKRTIFLWRYWYFLSIADISHRTGYSESKVKSMLFQIRKQLAKHLESEGIDL